MLPEVNIRPNGVLTGEGHTPIDVSYYSHLLPWGRKPYKGPEEEARQYGYKHYVDPQTKKVREVGYPVASTDSIDAIHLADA